VHKLAVPTTAPLLAYLISYLHSTCKSRVVGNPSCKQLCSPEVPVHPTQTCRFTPTQPTDPEANRVWSELLKRHAATQAAAHTTTTSPPRASSTSGTGSRPHSAAPTSVKGRPPSASPTPVTADSWGARSSAIYPHHQHQQGQRPWSVSPTAMSLVAADHRGYQQMGPSRPPSAQPALPRPASAREAPRPRFSSVSMATISQLGSEFRPPAVAGFSEPEGELVVPDPRDSR
jgi:hypothetical protein